MRNVNTIALVSLISVAVGIVLVGQRLDARWTGGMGYVEPCPATLVDGNVTVVRGQVMSTAAGEFATYRFCDGMLVYLDENTQVRLDSYRLPKGAYPITLNLLQGRIITDGGFDVRARNVVVGAGPGCELVHYSWLDELDVTSLTEQSCAGINGRGESRPPYQTVKYNTFDASIISIKDFKPNESSAKSFYEWTELSF